MIGRARTLVRSADPQAGGGYRMLGPVRCPEHHLPSTTPPTEPPSLHTLRRRSSWPCSGASPVLRGSSELLACRQALPPRGASYRSAAGVQHTDDRRFPPGLRQTGRARRFDRRFASGARRSGFDGTGHSAFSRGVQRKNRRSTWSASWSRNIPFFGGGRRRQHQTRELIPFTMSGLCRQAPSRRRPCGMNARSWS